MSSLPSAGRWRLNPVGGDSVRLRFGFWFRLTNGFLFEGLDALRAWAQEEKVRSLLHKLSPKGKALLTRVRGLEQQIGPEVLENVRQHTFHYPHPDLGKHSDSTVALADALRASSGLTADIDLRDDVEHTFLYADQVALGLAVSKHHEPEDERFDEQSEKVRDGAVAFAFLVREIYVAYCEEKGHSHRIIEHP